MSFYSVKGYSDRCYRTIRFPKMPYHSGPGGRKVQERTNEEKLKQSYLRAQRMYLEYALCNHWDYFVTFTISPKRFNRYNRFPIQDRLTQWFRDRRKKSGYEKLAYLLIFERHEDGAWHIHGFMSGIPDSALSKFVPGIHPRDLVDGDFLNWRDLSHKFGYCSLSPVRSQERAAFYCCKYVTKDKFRNVTDVGAHIYIHSQGLQCAFQVGWAYERNPVLDAQIQHETMYCDVGWVMDDIGVFFGVLDDWCTSPLFERENIVGEIEPDYEQCRIADFPVSSFYSPYGGIV